MRKEDGIPLLHSSIRLPTFPVLANPPFNDSDWFRKDDDPSEEKMARLVAAPTSTELQTTTGILLSASKW